ncbi:phosphonate ABC transporter, permease protein PhnE [Burkholderia sp. Bp9142]|uniref:phosphonate ABC transporter, permease protein PhnE n=1 Tax=Burkholderia sp. Bp9142 TaxID=2184573 RepID=UPI000F59BF4D|nr:phosphonate ABC transporter, permease protein PhnE [Burkholderia sp. Bp9142]RQR40731.1 phosphonate ABC transporter, permease protein PhnE [Burkholderia sp. Bp9142]
MQADIPELIRLHRRRALLQRAVLATFLLVGLLSLYIVGLFDIDRLVSGVPACLTILREMMPPDFSRWPEWVKPLADTFAMSVAGTVIAVLLGIPLALCAAANSTPHWTVYRAARIVLNFLRAVPELIMGIFLVAAVGFGALPGALALGLHSLGMVAKFFAESIEHVDAKPLEAAVAMGATPMQVVCHALLPQVVPQLADTIIYRWEYNFRASTLLGIVGAGGIGFEMMAALRILKYQEVCALMLVIFVGVTLVDGLGGALRRRLK